MQVFRNQEPMKSSSCIKMYQHISTRSNTYINIHINIEQQSTQLICCSGVITNLMNLKHTANSQIKLESDPTNCSLNWSCKVQSSWETRDNKVIKPGEVSVCPWSTLHFNFHKTEDKNHLSLFSLGIYTVL